MLIILLVLIVVTWIFFLSKFKSQKKDFDDLQKDMEDLLFQMDQRIIEVERSTEEGIRILKEDNRRITRDFDLIFSEQPKEKPKPIPVPLMPNKLELSTGLPVTKHGILVGSNGSGKSNVLMLLIMEKIKAGHEVHILDSKHELEQIFSDQAEVCHIDEAPTKFKEMVEIAVERQKLFLETSKEYKTPVRDIDEYRKVTGLTLPDISLIVEELILLKEYGIDESELVKALVAGRSAGVWITVVSQYLNNSILSLKGTVNFIYRIFLGRYNQYAFRALFGEVDKNVRVKAKDFVGDPGKAAVLIGNDFEMKQFPRLTDDYLEEWINGI